MKKDIKYVWAIETIVERRSKSSVKHGIIKGKKYEVFSEFETDEMLSGLCYIILTESNNLMPFDSKYFITDLEYESKKYNL